MVRPLSPESLAMDPLEESALLRDYLDHLSGLTLGVLPADERLRLGEETEFHLERLQSKYMADGMDSAEALRAAVRLHGDPAAIAEAFVESHYEHGLRSPLFRRFGRGNFVAFGVLGLAQMLYTAMLQWMIFLPSGGAYRLPINPGAARQLLPDPLLIPPSLPELAALYGYPLVVPVVCGWLVGRQVPIRAGRASATAMMPILVYSFVVGTLMLPVTAGLVFALIQVAWWLPATAAFSAIGSSMAREQRVRREARALLEGADGR